MTVDAMERAYADARSAPDPLFFYRLGYPVRVEDALLLVNVERNSWFENIVPLATFVERQRNAARSSLAVTAERHQGKAATPAAWIETVLSDEGVRAFENRYDARRTQATQLWLDLAARGRTTTLDSAERAERFDWWDAGNLTFWISESDLIARRFDLARAEIEGH